MHDLVRDNSGTVLYAATSSAGVWRRNLSPLGDWTAVNNGLTDLHVRDLAIDPNGVLYAATLGGMFKSTNGGQSWVQKTTQAVEVVEISPSSLTTVFLGTSGGGVMKSTDGGDSFTAHIQGLTDLHVQALAVHSTNGLIVMAGTETKGIFKSTDGGQTWQAKNSGIPDPTVGTSTNENYSVKAIAFQPNTNNVWMGSCHPSIRGTLFRSSDGVETWGEVPSSIVFEGVNQIKFFSQDSFAFATRNGVHYSTDGGATLQTGAWVSDTWAEIHSIEFGTVDNVLYEGLLGLGVYRTTNFHSTSEVCSPFNTGLKASAVYSIRDGGGYYHAALQEGGVFTSTDASSWAGPAPSLEFEPNRNTFTVLSLAAAPSDPSYVYAGAKRFGLWKSTNAGASWTRVPYQTISQVVDINSVVVDPINRDLVYAASFQHGVLKATDGINFSQTSLNTPIRSLAINPTNSNEILAGSFDFGLYRSTNGGATWQQASVTHQGFSRITAFSISFDPSSGGNRVLAGTNKGLFVSTDRGATWRLLTEGIPNNYITAVVHAGAQGRIYAGTYGDGVFASEDLGLSWTPVPGMQGTVVYDLFVDAAGTLLAATERGVLR
ncbi:MAG: WD40/YVTN/BNR-like repeat-containing protein [Acidobacteriota bacterium]